MRHGFTTIQRVTGAVLLLCTRPVSQTALGTMDELRRSGVAGSQPGCCRTVW